MTMTEQGPVLFAAAFAALYAAHHVGDYWVQHDDDARHKGDPGWAGAKHCLVHVLTYAATQCAFLALLGLVGFAAPVWSELAALGLSGVAHYAADRREYGLMFKIARMIPGKAAFLKLGAPREPWGLEVLTPCSSCDGLGLGGDAADASTGGKCWDCRGGGYWPVMFTREDNPTLATGAWALDQSWHIATSVFVPALLIGWAA